MSLGGLVRRELAGLRAYVPKPAEPAAIELDANESPWPLPDEASELVKSALARIELNRYPDPRAMALRSALAQRFGGDAESYLVGTGSDDVIGCTIAALAAPRDERPPAVLFPDPTFVMYGHAATAHGYRVVPVPLVPGSFALDVPAMERAIAEHRPNLVFLATPNNPTGNSFDRAAIEILVASDPGALFVIDEAYAAFAGETLASLADVHPNVAVLGTLSKVGFAAARVGFGRFPAELVSEIDKVRMPFNVSSLSLAVGELALGPLAAVVDTQVASIISERDRVFRALRALRGATVYPSQANFVLVRFDDLDGVQRALAAHRVVVRVFPTSPALAGCARITIGTPDENDRLLEALSVKS